LNSNGTAAHGVQFDANIATPSEGRIRELADIPNLQTLEIPPIDYLVPGLISRKTITLWTGADGTAKTFLALNMAIAVARGGQFLGRRCQQSPVLYLDYENPSFAARDRLDLMSGGELIPGLHIWGTWLAQQPPPIGSELLLTIAKESQPLIFVDPFRYAHTAEENDSTEMMGIMQQLRFCAAAGGAVVILHHPAKTEGSTGRGSSCIKGAADVAFLQEMADPNDGGLITLKCIKNRFGETHPVTIRPDFESGEFSVVDSPEFTKRTADCEKLREIIALEPGLTQNAIYKKSGMKKNRCVELLKDGRESMWKEEKRGFSLAYFPLVPSNGNNPGNRGTSQDGEGCSLVPCSYKGNRGTIPPKPDSVVPESPEQVSPKKLCAMHGMHSDWSNSPGWWICLKCRPAAAAVQ
jgi:hypothetical protein